MQQLSETDLTMFRTDIMKVLKIFYEKKANNCTSIAALIKITTDENGGIKDLVISDNLNSTDLAELSLSISTLELKSFKNLVKNKRLFSSTLLLPIYILIEAEGCPDQKFGDIQIQRYSSFGGKNFSGAAFWFEPVGLKIKRNY